MAFVVLGLALLGGLLLASTFVFDVHDGLVTLGWVAWLTSLALVIVASVLGAQRSGASTGSSLRHGARQAWEWLKAFAP